MENCQKQVCCTSRLSYYQAELPPAPLLPQLVQQLRWEGGGLYTWSVALLLSKSKHGCEGRKGGGGEECAVLFLAFFFASALPGSSGGSANFKDIFLQGLQLTDVLCRGSFESCVVMAGLQPGPGGTPWQHSASGLILHAATSPPLIHSSGIALGWAS